MSAITVHLYYDLDSLTWLDGLPGAPQLPIGIGENQTIDFAVRFVRSGAAVTLTTPDWALALKPLEQYSATVLATTSSASVLAGVYTFTLSIASAALTTFLASGDGEAVLQIKDATNGISTLPALPVTIYKDYHQ